MVDANTILKKIKSSRLESIDRYFDREYATSLSRNVIEFLNAYYFRARLIGFDETPQRNQKQTPLIYAGNHSGMSFPWDAIIFASILYKERGYQFSDACRALIAPALSLTAVMNPYFIDNFWKKAGGVDASMGNFEKLLNQSDAGIIIYPEGIAGIGKGFDHRYQLQRFSTSFVRMALKFRTDIIPVLTVNGEFINPMGYKSDFLNHLAQKIGIPFVPIGPLTGLVSMLPWSFYFGLPARLTYVRGRRIKVDDLTDKPYEKIKQKEMNRIRDFVQRQMQEDLSQAVSEYGQDPYHMDELMEIWFENKDKFMYMFPSGWPLLFKEHERLFLMDQHTQMSYDNISYIKALLRHPSVLAYHLPWLGWPMLLSRHGLGS